MVTTHGTSSYLRSLLARLSTTLSTTATAGSHLTQRLLSRLRVLLLPVAQSVLTNLISTLYEKCDSSESHFFCFWDRWDRWGSSLMPIKRSAPHHPHQAKRSPSPPSSEALPFVPSSFSALIRSIKRSVPKCLFLQLLPISRMVYFAGGGGYLALFSAFCAAICRVLSAFRRPNSSFHLYL